MSHDVGRGQEFETEEAFLRGFLRQQPSQRFARLLFIPLADEPQGLDEIGAGAAAGIEDDDVLAGEAIGEAEVFLQGAVHAGDHVFHDLGRGVPDAELLAQLGVELGEEGLVEVLDGFAEGEALEEGGALDAGERGLGPVEHFLQPEMAELLRVGELMEEGPQDGQTEVIGSFAPAEAVAGLGIAFIPQNPRGEDAVEERLYQSGAKEVFAFVALELDAERTAEGRGDGREGVGIRAFHAGAGFAGVAGEVGGEVLRRRKSGAIEQDAAEVFGEAFAEERVVTGVAGDVPKGSHAFRDVEVFARDRLAAFPRGEGKAAVVGEEDLPVVFEVIADLRGLRELAHVVIEGLDLQHAALGLELEEGGLVRVLAEFLRGEKAAVGEAGAVVRRVDDGADLRFEFLADGIEEIGERGIAGGLRSARAADGIQVREVAFHRVHAAKDAQDASGRARPLGSDFLAAVCFASKAKEPRRDGSMRPSVCAPEPRITAGAAIGPRSRATLSSRRGSWRGLRGG